MDEENAASFAKIESLSFKQMVRKILDEPEFASRLHAAVKKARDGDPGPCEWVLAHFKLTPEELKELGLSDKEPELLAKTMPTTFYMVDFAAYVGRADPER